MLRAVVRSRLVVPIMLVLIALPAQIGLAALAPPEAAGKLVEQIDVAFTHATFALNSPNDQGFRTHTHHVVNILVGTKGMGFDASFGNPGDGYGALEYARDLRASADVASAGWDGTAQNIALWLEKAAQEALRAAEALDRGDASMARTPLLTAIGLLSAAKGRSGESWPLAGALSLRDGLPQSQVKVEESSGGGGGYY